MLKNDTLQNQIINATFRLLAIRSWQSINLIDISMEAGTSFSELNKHYSSKKDILIDFSKKIDQCVLLRLYNEENDWKNSKEQTRNKIFDLIMMRLEYLQPYKPGLKNY